MPEVKSGIAPLGFIRAIMARVAIAALKKTKEAIGRWWNNRKQEVDNTPATTEIPKDLTFQDLLDNPDLFKGWTDEQISDFLEERGFNLPDGKTFDDWVSNEGNYWKMGEDGKTKLSIHNDRGHGTGKPPHIGVQFGDKDIDLMLPILKSVKMPIKRPEGTKIYSGAVI